jgi:thiol-disulfide isomerase/thioredoxin
MYTIDKLIINNPKITKINVNDPLYFPSTLNNRVKDLNDGISVYGFFEAPWCPDCLRAYPIINDSLKNLDKEIIIMDMYVKARKYLGNYNYPYRLNPKIKLVGIPQLVKWKLVNNEIEIDKVLNVSELSNNNIVNQFFNH